jgi:hypothetical protein
LGPVGSIAALLSFEALAKGPEKRVGVMVTGDRTVLGALSALVIISSIALTGCGQSGTAGADLGDYPDISLKETKAPAQLLRNEAAGRIPTAVIATIEETLDESVGCVNDKLDPDGLIRSWHSSAIVTMEPGSAWRVESVVDKLIASFVDQDWTAVSLGQTDDFRSSLLTSKKGATEIQIIGRRAEEAKDVEDADDVTIEVQVHGPCVRTAGPKSDEVLELEAP